MRTKRPSVAGIFACAVIYFSGVAAPGLSAIPPPEQGEDTASFQPTEIPPELMSENLDSSVVYFAQAMWHPREYPVLATLLFSQPKRYATLMAKYEEERRKGNIFGWGGASMNPGAGFGDYLRRQVVASEEFARHSAIAWKEGWGLTAKDMLPKLENENFPSTRRSAIEFLKLENNGIDLGYNWKERPDTTANQQAIKQWRESTNDQVKKIKKASPNPG